MAVKDTVDVYKYVAKKDGKLSLTYATLDITKAYIKVANAKGGTVTEFTDIVTGTARNQVYLKKGTYYITVDTDRNYGSYKLTTSLGSMPTAKLKSVKNYSYYGYYGYHKMIVKWGNMPNSTSYQVKYARNSKFKKAKTTTVSNYYSSATETTISGLKPKKTYYVKVRAVYQVGDSVVYSKWSKVKKVKIK